MSKLVQNTMSILIDEEKEHLTQWDFTKEKVLELNKLFGMNLKEIIQIRQVDKRKEKMSSVVNIRHQVTQHVMDWWHKDGSIGWLDKDAEGHLGLFIYSDSLKLRF